MFACGMFWLIYNYASIIKNIIHWRLKKKRYAPAGRFEGRVELSVKKC